MAKNLEGRMQSEVLEANKGKAVQITLTNSKSISGTLIDYDRYSVLVRTTEGKTSLLFKHGIMHIDEDNSSSQAK